jgi:hypothetical protein
MRIRPGLLSSVLILLSVLASGCASAAVPLSETSIAALRSSHEELERLVSTEQISPDQAEERRQLQIEQGSGIRNLPNR